jgi:hypothetical protein
VAHWEDLHCPRSDGDELDQSSHTAVLHWKLNTAQCRQMYGSSGVHTGACTSPSAGFPPNAARKNPVVYAHRIKGDPTQPWRKSKITDQWKWPNGNARDRFHENTTFISDNSNQQPPLLVAAIQQPSDL